MVANQSADSQLRAALDTEVRSLVQRFANALAQRPQILKCFADLGVQVEGWLKGEILAFLTQEKNDGRLTDFDREVLIGHGRRKADLTATFELVSGQHDAWIELRHYLIGFQKGTFYNSYPYFTDPTNGVKPDVDKLLLIPSANRYVLILTTANPGSDDWQSAVRAFNDKFDAIIHPLSEPSDFPDTFFLGLFYVSHRTESIE